MRNSPTGMSLGREDDDSALIVLGVPSTICWWRQADCTLQIESIEFIGVPCFGFLTFSGMSVMNKPVWTELFPPKDPDAFVW